MCTYFRQKDWMDRRSDDASRLENDGKEEFSKKALERKGDQMQQADSWTPTWGKLLPKQQENKWKFKYGQN